MQNFNIYFTQSIKLGFQRFYKLFGEHKFNKCKNVVELEQEVEIKVSQTYESQFQTIEQFICQSMSPKLNTIEFFVPLMT